MTTAFTAGNAAAKAVAVDLTNGTIVVAGVVVDGNGHNELALARYTETDGSLDTTFGPLQRWHRHDRPGKRLECNERRGRRE